MQQTTRNALSIDCASQKLLDLIADKWTSLILYLLAQKTHRYGELLHKIEGISKKMLTQVLRELESSGVISRKVYAVVPPMVEYSLTPLGDSLTPLLIAVKDWAETHMDMVLAAREKYAQQDELIIH